jgi:hypothetical protein
MRVGCGAVGLGAVLPHLVQISVVVSDGIDALLELLGREIAVGVSAGQRLDGVLLGFDLALDGVAGLAWLGSNNLWNVVGGGGSDAQ